MGLHRTSWRRSLKTMGTALSIALASTFVVEGKSEKDAFLPKQPWAAGAPAGSWVKGWGAAGDDSANAVAVDRWGNVYVGGGFSGTVDFDPGPGSDSRNSKRNSTSAFMSPRRRGLMRWAA